LHLDNFIRACEYPDTGDGGPAEIAKMGTSPERERTGKPARGTKEKAGGETEGEEVKHKRIEALEKEKAV